MTAAPQAAIDQQRPVLILGAGINGCALARELVLNRVPVCLVDTADIASGTSAYSTRLIHGGLRYLEYGEFDLVRESLEERTRLLRLAPQFVRPIELFIPTESRLSGAFSTTARMLRLGGAASTKGRGSWLVRCGLWLYDRFAHDPALPQHETHRVGEGNVPAVDSGRYRYLSSYYDAQIVLVERYVLALLEDARIAAAANGTRLDVRTYHCARRAGKHFALHSTLSGASPDDVTDSFMPSAVVNCTGAWVDWTLDELALDSPKLLAGTKGSHFLTSSPALIAKLGTRGVYVESADDARPIFILPFDGRVLVGTTDIPYTERPETAVASENEIAYLIRGANQVFPDVALTRNDVDMHYSGVRPLPRTDDKSTASVTRRHWLHEHHGIVPPTYSLIGGKLTTSRSLGETAANTVMTKLAVKRTADSRARIVPGGERYPDGDAALTEQQQTMASETGFTLPQVRASWRIYGTTAGEHLRGENGSVDNASLAGTDLPLRIVRRVIRDEWVTRLDDLVERRLMLLFAPLGRETLVELAKMLVDAGRLAPDDIEREIATTIDRLNNHFGKAVV
ncbi:MAG: glycerol-3-phosphate dehydrogenase/oxidase [Pirellulales bacterium]